MQRERYLGAMRWDYTIGGTGQKGTVEIMVPSGNRREDEMMARYYLRKKLKLGKLPRGTVVAPSRLA